MDRPRFQRPSLGFLARYANRVLAAERLPVEPFSDDGADFVHRLSAGTSLGYLVLACATRLKLLSLKSVLSLKSALSSGIDQMSVLFIASGVVRDIGISPDIAGLLLHNNRSQELYDALVTIATLTATAMVRGLEQETLTPVPFCSACIEDAGFSAFAKTHTFDDFTSVSLAPGDLCSSYLCSRAAGRAKSAASYSQNPHRLHFSSIRNHATLILISWMNYLYTKLNNLSRAGPQHYTGFDFDGNELRDFGNCIFGMYKLMNNEGNVPINLEPYPTLKDYFLATKGNIDSFFRVTFSKKHDYSLLDFLVFTASFKCPFHDLLLVDDDIFHNPEATIIVFSELFHFCNDLAYVVGARDMTKKLIRTKRITVSQKAKMYEPILFNRDRALSAKSLRSLRVAAKADTDKKARAAEQARRDEEARAAEQARRDEEARAAEQARRDEEARAAEQARRDEEARAAEQARRDEEARAAEQARRDEEARAAEQARRDEEARAAEQVNLAVNWSEFKMFCSIVTDLLQTFPASAPLRKIMSSSEKLHNRVTTSEFLKCDDIPAGSLTEFCTNFRNCIIELLDSFDSLFKELCSSSPPSAYVCASKDASRCKYLCTYEGDSRYFIHVGMMVLLHQLLFVLGGIFCSTCNVASPDLNSFNDLVSQKLKPYLKEPKDDFIVMVTSLCALVQKYLILVSGCDTDVNVDALKKTCTLSGEATHVTLPPDVYKANAVNVLIDGILSYSLCLTTSLIDSFNDISEDLWRYLNSVVAYLNMSYEIGPDFNPTTNFMLSPRAMHLKHFDILYRNYSKRNITLAMKALRDAYVSKTAALRQAEKLPDFVLWRILNGLKVGELDFNSGDTSTCIRTYYWVTVLEGAIEEIDFLLADIKGTATGGIAITSGDDRLGKTKLDTTITQASAHCLFVAPLQRTTFQHVCDTVTVLFKKLYQINNISIERSLLSQLLTVLIHYQDFGLAKLLEGADILLLSKLNITDPKQLVAMLRVFAKRTQSSILFSNPFSPLNVHRNKVDLVTLQPPDGHTVYLKLPQDSSSDESNGDGVDTAKLKSGAADDGQDASAQQPFNEASSNYHIQALKPLMNRFKEIAFSYNNEPDLLQLFGRVFTIFFGSFPLEFSNVLLESAAMLHLLIDLYKSGPYPGLFFILLPLTPYIALADKDLVYEHLWVYINKVDMAIKSFFTELMKAGQEQGTSIDLLLDSEKITGQIIRPVEIVTVFAESCSDEQDSENICQYLAKNSALFKTIMVSKCTIVLTLAHSYIILLKTLLSNEVTIAGVGRTGCPMIFGFLATLIEYVQTQGNIQCIELSIAAIKNMCTAAEKGILDTLLKEKENWIAVCKTLVQIASELSIKAYAMDALVDILVIGVAKARVPKTTLSSLNESRLTAAQREKIRTLS
ncbi:Hypothetical protein DHA2_154378 [Giardia duodenalis]|uniref:Uncharacterized protein n=1 Tax=Giardia intestinalis TaxID=5741 RepID=V6TDL4_GIAIN|nr:Hypothetical protein DHA2_154378 [Giardia intestinalis]